MWFSEDERILGFVLLGSQTWCLVRRVVERCTAEHLVEAEFIDGKESFSQNLYFLSTWPSLAEDDQCHTSKCWIGDGCNYLEAVNLQLALLVSLRLGG